MRRTLPWASSLALWLANVAVLVSLYGLLPHRVAMHWDLLGRPDGWGSPAVALGSLAIAGLAVAVVALLAQRDALRRRGGGTPWTTLPCDAVQGLLLGIELCLWREPSPAARLHLPARPTRCRDCPSLRAFVAGRIGSSRATVRGAGICPKGAGVLAR